MFWLLVAVVVAVASYRLGLGTISQPGSGFLPFWASVLLGLLSLVSFGQAAANRKNRPKPELLFAGRLWWRAVLAFVALAVWAQVVPFSGYNLATFFLMTFLFWLAGRQRLWRVAAYSLGTTVITYYVFSRALNLQVPAGPFGF